MKNPYTELNIKKDTPKAEIKKQYKEFVKNYHPDVGGDSELFKDKQQYYDIVLSDKKRAQYDKTGNCEPDNTNQEIIQFIMLIIQEIIKTDPANIDDFLKSKKDDLKLQFEQHKRRLEKESKNINNFKKRVKYKKKQKNYISDYIETETNRIALNIQHITEGFDVVIKAFEYMKINFSFENREEISVYGSFSSEINGVNLNDIFKGRF